MKQLYQLLKTGYKERKVLLMTSVLIAAIRLGLLLLPFQRLLKLLDQCSQQNTTVSLSVRKILWSVNAVSRRIPGIKCKCLARALTTQVLMKRYGHASKLQIGVAKTAQGNLEAHAWVEVGGVIAIGNLPDVSRFIPLSSLEGVKQ